MLRSVAAVIAGIATLTVTSFAIEAVTRPQQETAASTLFMFTYSVLCVAAGGYVTAWAARHAKVRHALIMGGTQTALVIPAMMSFPDEAPLWRWLLGMAVIIPAAWCGAKIRDKQTPEKSTHQAPEESTH